MDFFRWCKYLLKIIFESIKFKRMVILCVYRSRFAAHRLNYQIDKIQNDAKWIALQFNEQIVQKWWNLMQHLKVFKFEIKQKKI